MVGKKLIIKLLLKITELGITETELPRPLAADFYRITATETEVLKLPRPIIAPKCWLPRPPLVPIADKKSFSLNDRSGNKEDKIVRAGHFWYFLFFSIIKNDFLHFLQS